MLNVTITSASVRTGRLPISQRSPSAMSWRTWVSTCSRTAPWACRCGTRARRPARRRRPGRRTAPPSRPTNRNAPSGGADELVDGDEAGHEPGVGDAEVGLVDQHRGQGAGGGVGEDLGRAEREDRTSTSQMLTSPVTIDDAEEGEDDRTDQVDDDDDQAPVEPVGERAGAQPEAAATAAAKQPRRARPAGCASARRPAAARPPSSTPSPRLLAHDDASSQRNPMPRRAGTTVSTRRLTSA